MTISPTGTGASITLGHGLPRPFELVAVVIGLLLAAPVIALAAVAIAATSRGPVLFRQKRVGRAGRHFVLYKLRTMRQAPDGLQVTAGDDDRMTRVGRFLRKTKLDELPELWNVLKGDMALVGPRPEVPRYVNLDNPAWRLVLRARPGITDPVTMRLRNEETLLAAVESDRERFYLEVLQPLKLQGYLEYLRARNWWRDVKVLWQSGVVVLLPGRVPPPTINELLTEGQRTS